MNAPPQLTPLERLRYDNRFVNDLPGDPETGNFTRQVFGAAYSRVNPAKASHPQLIAFSREAAELIDLTEQDCQTPLFTQVFAGNKMLPGMMPYASCYGGHQFGVWAGQLGDGRAINLGDVINSNGERWALQLKGSGLTPYSRTADGLAVLRSSVREFLCSEAMHHLGVPTTLALSLTLTGDRVVRDMFYNGNPKAEPGAVVCRMAPTFIRFGHFQIFSARGEFDLLKQLTDHTINTHFPHLGKPNKGAYLAWYAEVCRSTAELMVQWERVGFVHGVMNTDNMSILGLTIDYGPYGWLDNYDPDWTPNTTDRVEHRYRFGNQPGIAFWNLAQLGNAIYPLINDVEPLQDILYTAWAGYERDSRLMLSQKLGLNAYEQNLDEILQNQLIALLQSVETDMTIFFRQLAEVDLTASNRENVSAEHFMDTLTGAFYKPDQLSSGYVEQLSAWLSSYKQRLQAEGIRQELRREKMYRINPKYVLRNYLAQMAIDKAEQGDFTMINELLGILRQPYAEQPEHQHYYAKRPEWARSRPGCSMLSCSS